MQIINFRNRNRNSRDKKVEKNFGRRRPRMRTDRGNLVRVRGSYPMNVRTEWTVLNSSPLRLSGDISKSTY